MTYRVEQTNDNYSIIEKDTELNIFQTQRERDARELCRSLNLGGGFNGYTPVFFTQGFKQKERPSIQ